MQLIGLVSLGIVAGLLSGLFGVGGGIVIVPALVVFFGMTQQSAGGTSLISLLLPVGLLGMLEYYRSGKISMDNIWMGLTDTITGTPSGRVFFHSNNLANAGTLSPKVINASCKNMSLGLRS